MKGDGLTVNSRVTNYECSAALTELGVTESLSQRTARQMVRTDTARRHDGRVGSCLGH